MYHGQKGHAYRSSSVLSASLASAVEMRSCRVLHTCRSGSHCPPAAVALWSLSEDAAHLGTSHRSPHCQPCMHRHSMLCMPAVVSDVLRTVLHISVARHGVSTWRHGSQPFLTCACRTRLQYMSVQSMPDSPGKRPDTRVRRGPCRGRVGVSCNTAVHAEVPSAALSSVSTPDRGCAM